MRGSFFGWYFKCQSDTQTLAVIPAVHQVGRNRTCSIQIITDDDTWVIEFPADVFRKKGKTICIEGNLELEACLLKQTGHPLKAPIGGDMSRVIHESAACRVSYRFRRKKRTLFAFASDRASFEYEYPF